MASHTIADGEWGIHNVTLTAGAEDTFTFPDDVTEVEVLSHDGAATIYFTVDGTAATITGRHCRILPAAVSSVTAEPPTAGPTVVRVISSGTPTISVTRT